MAVRIEEAGVAGLDVAVGGQRFGRGVFLLEVAGKHAWRPELHLALIGDADVDIGRSRPDRIGANRAILLNGDVEKGLGLAVELLEIDAKRAEEGEQVLADRLARRIGDADVGKAKHILQRRVDQEVSERIGDAARQRRRAALEDRLAIFLRDADVVTEQLALEPAGILHADGDAGQKALENARRREIEGRADLAKILRHRLVAFRAVHAEARDVALRVVEIVVADPGQRQVCKHAVAFAQSIEFGGVAGGLDRIGRLHHHALRATGGAGGVEHDADVFAACLADAGFPAVAECRIGLEKRISGFLHGRKRMQAGGSVVVQPAGFVIDEIGKSRNFCAAGPDLVDLLLILHHRETHSGMVEHIGHFVCDRVGIDGNRDCAERLRRREGPVEAWPVGPDDGDGVAAPETERLEANRQRPDFLELLAPGPALPDAVILVAHGGAIAQPLGIAQEVFRECVHVAGGCRRNHVPAPPGPAWFAEFAAIMPADDGRASPSLESNGFCRERQCTLLPVRRRRDSISRSAGWSAGRFHRIGVC